MNEDKERWNWKSYATCAVLFFVGLITGPFVIAIGTELNSNFGGAVIAAGVLWMIACFGMTISMIVMSVMSFNAFEDR